MIIGLVMEFSYSMRHESFMCILECDILLLQIHPVYPSGIDTRARTSLQRVL